MAVTLAGIVTLMSPLQYWKVELPNEDTPEGMIIEVRPEQPENAFPPIVTTVDGRTIFVSSQQFKKAEIPISVNPEGNVMVFNARHDRKVSL
jgi:hypothetical protein